MIKSTQFITILIIALIYEIALGGSGAWSINVFGFSIRKALFILINVSFLVSFLTEKQQTLAYIQIAITIMFFLIWGLLIPSIKGTNLIHSISDFLPLIGITLVAIFTSKTKKLKVNLILKHAFYASFISALIHIIIYILFITGNPLIDGIKLFIIEFFMTKKEFAADNINISDAGNGNVRVFWASSSFLVLGYTISIYRYILNKTFINLILIFILGLAVFATYLEAFMAFVVFIPISFKVLNAVIIKDKFTKLSILKNSIFMIAALLLIQLSIYLATGSDSIRQLQAIHLLNTIGDNFFWGVGFGGSSSVIRSEFSPWTYELSIIALIMKLGLIGSFILSIIVVMLMLIPLNGKKISLMPLKRKTLVLLSSFLIGYLFIGSTNPFIFSLVGWQILMVTYLWYINTLDAKN